MPPGTVNEGAGLRWKEPSPAEIKFTGQIVMGKNLLLIVIVILAAVSFTAASAQDVDISNMDNEQLLQLLQAIMQKLDASEEPAAETVDTEKSSEVASVMIPAEDPEKGKFSIWSNKKLIIEALPGYMFIPKEQDEPSDKPDPKKKQSTPNPPEHYENEPGYDEYGPCSWAFFDGKWVCMKG